MTTNQIAEILQLTWRYVNADWLSRAGIFKKWAQIWCQHKTEKWPHNRNWFYFIYFIYSNSQNVKLTKSKIITYSSLQISCYNFHINFQCNFDCSLTIICAQKSLIHKKNFKVSTKNPVKIKMKILVPRKMPQDLQ